MRTLADDTGRLVRPARHGRARGVTRAVAHRGRRGHRARACWSGATDWCTHPADLDVARVRGTKNPDVDRVVALRPTSSSPTPRRTATADLDALRAAGVAVYVTDIRTVDERASRRCERMLAACGLAAPGLARRRRGGVGGAAEPRRAAPGGRADLAAAVDGGRPRHVHRRRARPPGRRQRAAPDYPERYPRIDPAALPPHDLVVLPDEPYAFTADDGPEAFPGVRAVLVSRQAPDLVRALAGRGPRRAAVGAQGCVALTSSPISASPSSRARRSSRSRRACSSVRAS